LVTIKSYAEAGSVKLNGFVEPIARVSLVHALHHLYGLPGVGGMELARRQQTTLTPQLGRISVNEVVRSTTPRMCKAALASLKIQRQIYYRRPLERRISGLLAGKFEIAEWQTWHSSIAMAIP